jgi:hypothetical protein
MLSLLSCTAGPAGLSCQPAVTLQTGTGVGVGTSVTPQVTGTATGTAGSGSLFGYIAQAFASAAQGLLKTLTTFWMNVGTPQLSGKGTPVAVITADTSWMVTLIAVGCILVAAARLAIRRRGEPVGAMLLGLVRLVFVTASATFIVQAAGSLGDQWSASLMNSAHMGTGGWSTAISVTALAGAFGGGDGVLLIVSLLLVFSALIQLMLMVLRTGLLIVLTGTLPLAAAASMCEWGESWWRKHIGWLVAWLLYKPAAALLYVGAFALTNGKSLTEVLAGWMLLILSVLILPALLRLVVPLTAALGAASAGGVAMAATGALASSAIRGGGLGGAAAALAGRLGRGPSGSASAAGGQSEPGGDEGTGRGGPPSGAGTDAAAGLGRPRGASGAGTGTGAGSATPDETAPAAASAAAGLPLPSGGQQAAGAPGARPPASRQGAAGAGSALPVPGGAAGVTAGPSGAGSFAPAAAPRAVPADDGGPGGGDPGGTSPSGAVDGDDDWTAENRGTGNE